MSKGILVEMPERVYVSYQAKQTLENEFYFTIYKEYQGENRQNKEILTSPIVTISGFEQLLIIPKKDKKEQEEQIREAAERFIQNLSVPSLWGADYVYDSDNVKLSIRLKCMDQELKSDFKIKAATNRMICNSSDTQKPVVLTVHTEGFEEIFGESEKYQDYRTDIDVVYAPCITKFEAVYDNQTYSEQVYVNPDYQKMLTLSWEYVGNGRLEHTLRRADVYIKEASAVSSIEEVVENSVIYTLRVDNQKGFSDIAQIQVDVTGWRRIGKVTGLFTDPSVWKEDVRLHCYKENYYCYRNEILYRSRDGCAWEECSKNTLSGQGEKPEVTATQIFGSMLYVMEGHTCERLRIMRYHFEDDRWEAARAHQNCISADGHLAFSSRKSFYAQTVGSGISVSGHDEECEWMYWNREHFQVDTQGREAVNSDFCFRGKSFYAVILCSDGRFYLYECREEQEEALWSCDAEGADKMIFLPTVNHFFIATPKGLFDADKKQRVKDFFPPTDNGFWMGADREGVAGIFSDGSFWEYKEV